MAHISKRQRRVADLAARKGQKMALKRNIPNSSATPLDRALTQAELQAKNQAFMDNYDAKHPALQFSEEDIKEARQYSEARLEANRRAAEASAGPRTPEGKAKVSKNALKTALTGRTVLLPFDDIHAYKALADEYLELFQPVGPIERGLVQSIVDTCWRLERIPVSNTP